MSSINDIGTGFLSGLGSGYAYGRENQLRAEMRRMQLEDRAAALKLEAELRAQAQARDDARYRDQMMMQQRRLDMQAPAASLGFLRADAQGGPLTAADAAREQALMPLAFQEVQREEETRRRQAEIDAAAAAERAARTGYYNERASAEKAGKLGTAAAAFVDNSQLAQAMRELMTRKPAKPDMEEVVLERDPETGEMVPAKITRRQPVGARPSPTTKTAGSPAASNPYITLAGKDKQDEEAQRKKLAEERIRLEKEKAAALKARGFEFAPSDSNAFN